MEEGPMTAVHIEETMKLRPRSEFVAVLNKAGIRRSDLAREANLSTQTIQRLAKPESYRNNDRGYVSSVSAWRVARAFGRLAGMTDDEAFAALFIEEAEGIEE